MGSTAAHMVSLTLNDMMRNVRNFMEVHLEYGLYSTNFRKIMWGTKHRFLMAACRLCVCVCVRASVRARAFVVPN
jgi:hypothetical protein